MPQPPSHPIIPNPLSHHHTPGSKMAREEDIKTYGFSALPRSTTALLASRVDPKQPTELTVEDIPLPESPLVEKVVEYARRELPVETFNHSMRVFYYGMPAQKFPN
jgi:cyanamide hydratase